MRRIITACTILTLTLSFAAFSGCGEDKKVDTIVDSPEAKKADAGVKQGMQDYMKTKDQKPGSKAK